MLTIALLIEYISIQLGSRSPRRKAQSTMQNEVVDTVTLIYGLNNSQDSHMQMEPCFFITLAHELQFLLLNK